MKIVKTSPKCQIVIPVAVRRRLGIRPGQYLNIEVVNEKQMLVTPVPRDVVKHLTGSFSDCRPSLARELVKDREEDDRE